MPYRRPTASRALLALLLTVILSPACKKTVRFDRKPAPPAPTKQPIPDGSQGSSNTEVRQPETVPDTKLKLEIKSLNAESWWKVCLEAWVIEFPQTRQVIGCNTDSEVTEKVIELASSSKQCNTVALSFQVFKNTKPCSGSANTCEHEMSPKHTRTTSQNLDQDFFRAAYLPDLKLPFARKDLTAVAIPTALAKDYAGSGNPKSFRVFFEDQPDASMSAWKAGGDARANGIDYFDYVVEIGSADAPIALEGSSTITCAKP